MDHLFQIITLQFNGRDTVPYTSESFSYGISELRVGPWGKDLGADKLFSISQISSHRKFCLCTWMA